MKSAFFSLLFAVSLCAATPEEGVRATLDSWSKAMTAKDGAALAKIYHNDLSYEHSNGKTETKEQAIAAVLKAPVAPTAVEFTNPSIHVYGNTALAKGFLDINSATGKNHLDALFVLLKTGSSWQIVARQATKIPVDAPK